ncbi:Predicted arabinose efflux permease, MFS family [Nonomuraea solani]|uniref:Predicted arabinose efflux permease, MFS family n=2 Tax=Nonomuraea solani TaxID=1144553 RepID=A0A1H6EIN3_9ACTN|nr:Predicted arabinose efflux permease, MFS family [Nonomuraea solani]
MREFRAMWLAELTSVAGDQLARVALAVLVYQRTASAGLTGLTYALTYLPSLVGGLLLSGLADRYPRRNVMIVTDLARVALVAPMAIPGTPFWVLCVLLALMVTLHGPFKAAQLAMLADVLTGEKYVVGLAIRHITIQSAQLAGFAGGGALVAFIGPSTALALNAATFALSAGAVWWGVSHRPAARPKDRNGAVGTTAGGGMAVIWKDPVLRTLTLLAWLCGFHVTPEALAAPYATSLGEGAVAVGLIMASDPAGSVIGALVFTRWVPSERRVRLIGVLAVLAGIPLLFGFLYLPLVASMALFALSGAFAMAYHTQLGASFAQRIPDEVRAQGLGVMSTGVITVQGLGALAAGVLADALGSGAAIALAGVAATLVAVPAAISWGRGWQDQGATIAAERPSTG